jgi:asparagine synthetase A
MREDGGVTPSAVAGVASLPCSRRIGGGIGHSRTYMYLLHKAHIGEFSVTAWPDELHRICEERNIHVLG